MRAQDISIGAIFLCISRHYEPSLIKRSCVLFFSCHEINHIYHNFLKSHVLAGNITQYEVLRALRLSFMTCGKECNREGLYTTLAELLNIEIL